MLTVRPVRVFNVTRAQHEHGPWGTRIQRGLSLSCFVRNDDCRPTLSIRGQQQLPYAATAIPTTGATSLAERAPNHSKTGTLPNATERKIRLVHTNRSSAGRLACRAEPVGNFAAFRLRVCCGLP